MDYLNNKKRSVIGAGWIKAAVVITLSFAAATGFTQNINNPNRPGPLNTNVNTLSGNLFIARSDMYVPARQLSLDISFFYNSYLYDREFSYGKGWSFQYNIRYKADTIPGARTIFWGDGREDRYDSLGGGAYAPPRGFFTSLVQYQPNKYVLVKKDSVKYFFDNAVHKRVTRMQEPNGNFINFSYTDSLLTSLTNNAGQTINFAYGQDGRLASITDAIATPARTFTCTYDASGNLKEVKDPLNNKCLYTYLVNGPMKTITDKNGNTVDIIYYSDFSVSELIGCNKRQSFSYDTSTNTTIVTDHLSSGNRVTKYMYERLDKLSWISGIEGNCCGFNMKYKYDDKGNNVEQQDANGNIYRYTYDAKGNLLTVTDPLGGVHTYTYSANFNKVTSYKDPKGNIETLSYDSKGNMTGMTTPGGRTYSATYNSVGDIISSTDPKGYVYTYTYDAFGNSTGVTGPEGYNATLSYDARGNLLSYTDALGKNYTGEFDILDRLKKITDPANSSIQYTYDAEGNIIAARNKNNESRTISYDASNRVVKISRPGGFATNYGYNAMDELTSVKDPLGHEIKISYDNRGLVTGLVNADNNAVAYSRDANGNVTAVNMPNGRMLSYSYDALNRLTAVADQNGSLGSFVYDPKGNSTSFTNATGAVTTALYDSLNRITQVTDPLGYKTMFSYDKNNNLVSKTDREGRTSTYSYDNMNRVKTYTDNNGYVLTIGYDAKGNAVSLKDQNNNITTYTYDQLNRRQRMTYPDGTYEQLGYDRKSNVISKRLTDGTVINYTYDSLNRVVARILPGGETYSYTYDVAGRVLTATNSAGTIAFTYDLINRVTSETFDGRTVAYTYNVSGRSAKITYPGNSTVTHEYDKRNRLIKTWQDSTVIAEYSYNNANQLTEKTYGNGLVTSMAYDFANRLTGLTTAGGTVQNTVFTYDRERNKLAVTRLSSPTLSEQFVYDNGYRLLNYKRGAPGNTVTQNAYTYDAVGNRVAANINGSVTNYGVNNLNQLTAVNGTAFTYDSRGNITYDDSFYKTYDAENRLVKDSSSPSSVIRYGYDAFSRRVTKSLNGNLLKYTYSRLSPIEERDAANNLLTRNVFSSFLSPLTVEKNGSRNFYHANELGSVEAITTSAGRVAEQYRYDVYGKQSRYDSLGNLLVSSPSGNRFGFTGQEYDSATAAIRFYYRTYSPATGTFNQRDPIEYADRTGMYQYVGNNPANGVDILGLRPCPPKSSSDPMSWYDSFSDGKTVFEGLTRTSLPGSGPLNMAAPVVDLYKTDQSANSMSTANTSESATMHGGDLVKNGTNAGLGFTGTVAGVLGSEATGAAATATAAAAVEAESFGVVLTTSYSATATSVGAAGVAGTAGVAGGAIFATDKLSAYGMEVHITMEMDQQARRDEWAAKDYYVSLGKDEYERVQRLIKYNQMQARKDEQFRRWQDNCDPPGGTRRPPPPGNPGSSAPLTLVVPVDPNAIIGPDGEPSKKWVSVKDGLPYTVLFENDTSATAPAKFIRITTRIEPKEDAATFELGSFGFNNQSFDIPPGTPSYYQRLDCRDSLGLYVDITAGYDQIRNEAFWELQSIDPITQLPSSDPDKGLLRLQDTLHPEDGNGFVNFSIKPKTNAVTLDTIGQKAYIVFDSNDTIPTNTHTNTIDAFAPTSHINTLPATSTSPVHLSWTGADDLNGCGIRFYTLYTSSDGVNFSILKTGITRLDTTIALGPNTSYSFFVLATDSVGNTEILGPGGVTSTFIGGVVPVTLLSFRGRTVNKDNILDWSTATEQNSKHFKVERSFNGTDFTDIGTVAAAGNSATIKNYNYTDRNIDKFGREIMYYRLRQIDLSNNFTLSNIVKLNYKEQAAVASIVYPNPTRESVTVRIGDSKLIGSFASVYDQSGRLLARVKITTLSQLIDLSKYAAGTYIISLQNKESLRVLKL